MQNIKDKMLNAVKDYKEKHCNNKGVIKMKNISKSEEEGLEILRNRIKDKEVVVFESDKTGHFTADTVENYERSLRDHIQNDSKINKKKTKVISFTKSRKWDFPPELYFSDGAQIECISETKLVGWCSARI